MSVKPQTMINVLTKCCQKYFLYKRTPEREESKVRLRDNVHRAEEAAIGETYEKLMQRQGDMGLGMMTPFYKPYVPVDGWPVLELDDLVLNAWVDQLDPKVKPAVRKYFDKADVARTRRERNENILKDMKDVHTCVTAGYSNIKTHLKESEDRMQQTLSGKRFEDHFMRVYKERITREATHSSPLLNWHKMAYGVSTGRNRMLEDEIKFLEILLHLIEKMLQLRIRHLKSIVPINLEIVGTWRDKEVKPHTGKRPTIWMTKPAQHSFKDQILQQAPRRWPISGSKQLSRPVMKHISIKRSTLALSPEPSTVSEKSLVPDIEKKVSMKEESDIILCAEEIFPRKWPTLWQGLAAAEQGSNFFEDPSGKTKTKPDSTPLKYVYDIKAERSRWAQMRKEIERKTGETLTRCDDEKIDFFRECYSSLEHIPIHGTWDQQQRMMDKNFITFRHKRQKRFLYDYELNEWYKNLQKKEWEQFGKNVVSINNGLAKIKQHFKLSPTYPKFAKAKLALITMSMPATLICHIHVQRALDFLLREVMCMPPETLAQWLSTRGLPKVFNENLLRVKQAKCGNPKSAFAQGRELSEAWSKLTDEILE